VVAELLRKLQHRRDTSALTGLVWQSGCLVIHLLWVLVKMFCLFHGYRQAELPAQTPKGENKSQRKSGIEKQEEGARCRFLAVGLACQVEVLMVESGRRAYTRS